MVRIGALPEVLQQLLAESGATEIVAEEEVEYRSVCSHWPALCRMSLHDKI